MPPNLSSQYLCGTRCRDVLGLGPYGCRVALQINSCCTMPVSATLGRACDVEWAAHARHVARAPKPKRPVVTGSQCPGTVYQGGGAFALRAPLSTTGELGRRLRRFICASEWSPQRYLEANTGTPRVVSQTKQNKTKRGPQLAFNRPAVFFYRLVDSLRDSSTPLKAKTSLTNVK